VAFGAGLFAAGALIYTARNFTLSRRTVELTRQTFELTEQGQVTDRFTKAIEQLGSDKLDVRLGGIYALERIARDSAQDHPTVMEVLAAFIREHSLEQWPSPDTDSSGRTGAASQALPDTIGAWWRARTVRYLAMRSSSPPGDPEQERLTRPDVQAAITVVGRRDAKRDILPIDLTHADLAGANLVGLNLTRANLTDASLTGVPLTGADLTRAHLTRADLRWADLNAADLTGAYLTRAHLTGAVLDDADGVETIYYAIPLSVSVHGFEVSVSVYCFEGDCSGVR